MDSSRSAAYKNIFIRYVNLLQLFPLVLVPPICLNSMCVFSAGLNDYLCLILLGDRVEEILALQTQSSALSAYRYGAPTGFFSTINLYLVPDIQHESLLSDHPDTYTSNFNE